MEFSALLRARLTPFAIKSLTAEFAEEKTRSVQGKNSVHVPAAYFHHWPGCLYFAGAISCGYLALVARQQGNVLVLPHHGQNLLSRSIHFQSHKKHQAL